MSESRRKSIARFNRRNRLVTAKGRPRLLLNTPHGQTLTRELFLEPLAEFLAGKLAEKPDKAPPPSPANPPTERLQVPSIGGAIAALGRDLPGMGPR